MDINGTKQGDDIIIYDQLNFPTLKTNTKSDFSRKENIPIEAVYAYIEAKHTLTNASLEKSIYQISQVKALCLSRSKTDLFMTDPCIGSFKDRGNVIESLPKYRNPILTIILSRYCSNLEDKKAESEEEIQDFLKSGIEKLPNDNTAPELIIAGKNNLIAVGYKKDSESIPTLFYPDNGFQVGYQNIIKTDLSYGIFLSHLMASLNYIRLGNMPWIEILNQAKTE